MHISDLLHPQSIDLYAAPKDKNEALDRLVELMCVSGNISNPDEYRQEVLKREAQGSTGIGEGVAIPHAKTKSVKKAGLSVIVIRDGVNFDALDGRPVHLAFLIAAPDSGTNIHLEVLSRLSMLLMDEEFRDQLIHADSPEHFYDIIDQEENKNFFKKLEDHQDPDSVSSNYQILAVTACPTGIAHTYMAAEGLEKMARKMGVSIKVETNGSGGAKNVLTDEDIQQCQAIIVAADRTVETARFDGKPVLFTKVADGIHKPKELLEKAIEGDLPIFHSEQIQDHHENDADAHVGKKAYNHLMNGISRMLPFVIGGGILIALAYLFDSGSSGSASFGQGNPFSAFLYGIGQLSFGMMFPILAAYIAESIADRPALVVGLVGGLIASGAGTDYFGGSTSGFFGALFAGFIGGFIVLLLKKACSILPKSLESIKPVLIYPVFGILIMGAIMVFIINPPVALFNDWLISLLNSMGDSSKIILGIVLGAMMSIDFGGPINKAAYVFGTISLTTGQPYIMAAVMIGGMVPPLAIALCTTFFKNRFTKEERQTGLTCYVMGLCFVTEGAIPFAAASPLRVIPACAIGSAVAGGLSMLFNCTLGAPHGGIFVLPIIGNWPLFLLALAIGSVVGMALLALFKRPIRSDAGLGADKLMEEQQFTAFKIK